MASSVHVDVDGTKRHSALVTVAAVLQYTTVVPDSTRRANAFTPAVPLPPGWTGYPAAFVHVAAAMAALVAAVAGAVHSYRPVTESAVHSVCVSANANSENCVPAPVSGSAAGSVIADVTVGAKPM